MIYVGEGDGRLSFNSFGDATPLRRHIEGGAVAFQFLRGCYVGFLACGRAGSSTLSIPSGMLRAQQALSVHPAGEDLSIPSGMLPTRLAGRLKSEGGMCAFNSFGDAT